MSENLASPVSLKRSIVVFALSYFGLLVLFSIVVALIGAKSNHGLNAAALVCAGVAAIQDFAKKHSRNLTRREKTTMTVASVVVDVVYQLGNLALVIFSQSPLSWSGEMAGMALGAIGAAVIIALFCHTLLLAYVYGSLSNKLLKKMLENKA